MIIAIDGLAGAGKSTIAKKLAQKTGLKNLYSGAIYRAFALKAITEKIDITDKKAINKLCKTINIKIKFASDIQKTFLDDKDVTKKIHTEKVSEVSSVIARFKSVRKLILKIQRQNSKENLIVDGRDIGTKVFPNADYKFFFLASPEVRAERRLKQLKEEGDNIRTYESVLSKIIERDNLDTTRKISPAKPAKNAIVIDTGDKTIEEVVNVILSKINLKKGE